MDYTVFDNTEEISPTEQQINEINQLAELAQNVGSYTWAYDKGDDVDGKIHDGIIAQDLLKVPALRAAVIDKGDHLEIDTRYVATAALGYVAALTRLLMNIADKQGNKL